MTVDNTIDLSGVTFTFEGLGEAAVQAIKANNSLLQELVQAIMPEVIAQAAATARSVGNTFGGAGPTRH